MAYSTDDHERFYYKISCRSCGFRDREDCFIALNSAERPSLSCPRCQHDPTKSRYIPPNKGRRNKSHGDPTYQPNTAIEQSRMPLDPPNGPFKGRLTVQDLPGVQAVYDKYKRVSEQDET